MAVKKKAPSTEQSCIPKVEFERNKYGLICNDDIKYVYNDDGTVNWRKMVKTEFLVTNRQKTKETDVSKLDDKDLLILLGGIKELAQIRGFTSVEYDIHSPSSDYVVATCKIAWIPNYETEYKETVFSAVGDASPINTTNFARNYLGPIAENRAFVRCVRSFLKINIVASDEVCIGKPAASPSNQTGNQTDNFDPTDPVSLLAKLMNSKSVTLDSLKSKLKKEGYEKADSIQSLKDIPSPKIFELLKRLQNKK